MHAGYLALTILTLVLGIACFLAPGFITQLSQLVDRSVGVVHGAILNKRPARYVLGLLLLLVSFGFFRLAYLTVLFK